MLKKDNLGIRESEVGEFFKRIRHSIERGINLSITEHQGGINNSFSLGKLTIPEKIVYLREIIFVIQMLLGAFGEDLERKSGRVKM